MKKILPMFLALTLLGSQMGFALNFNTPGTGVKWSLNDLVANVPAQVSLVGSEYFILDTITISTNDTLEIVTNATVKFSSVSFILVHGVIIINPPTQVLFTAQDVSTRFLGLKLDMSVGSIIKKLTMEYANSLQLFDSSPLIDSCTFKHNALNTNFGRSVINLFRSKATISHSLFENNHRLAISGGANIANAPRIIGNTFKTNNLLNENKPQVNLGASGADTTFILNNNFQQASIKSGGIGFLPLGDLHTVIKQNVIVNNRFGIVLQGGSNINALISYNHIEGNNIEGNPNLGGSGIAFAGGSASSHQNSVVTGNLFKNNLWGITIQNGSQPNLGNLTNSDTADDGKNHFINNTNANLPNLDLYNNSPDAIFAQGNYWNTNVPTEIENKIFHQPDNASLGPVNYDQFLLPVTLLSFDAAYLNQKVLLQWRTTAETNSRLFNIERSTDGQTFTHIGFKNAAGNSNQIQTYQFTDPNIPTTTSVLYYRLKLVDQDNGFVYSKIVSINLSSEKNNSLKLYPTLLHNTNNLHAEIKSLKAEKLWVSFLDAKGAVLQQQSFLLQTGINNINIAVPANLPKAVGFVKFKTGKTIKTISVINQ